MMRMVWQDNISDGKSSSALEITHLRMNEHRATPRVLKSM